MKKTCDTHRWLLDWSATLKLLLFDFLVIWYSIIITLLENERSVKIIMTDNTKRDRLPFHRPVHVAWLQKESQQGA